jgi:hypothetical protein
MSQDPLNLWTYKVRRISKVPGQDALSAKIDAIMQRIGLAGTWQPCSRLLFGSSDPFKAHIRIKAVGQSTGWPAHPPAFCMAPGF